MRFATANAGAKACPPWREQKHEAKKLTDPAETPYESCDAVFDPFFCFGKKGC